MQSREHDKDRGFAAAAPVRLLPRPLADDLFLQGIPANLEGRLRDQGVVEEQQVAGELTSFTRNVDCYRAFGSAVT
jgi:predicted flap endonuclease-1-like 5' DNA nuclease